MTDAAILDGRQRGEAQRATSAVLDLLLAEIGVTFDRWVVQNAVAAESLPAEVGLLVPALSAALDATGETIRSMLDDAESAHHLRVVSAPSGDPAAARVELTAEGEDLHERLRAAIDELTAELSAGIPRRDLDTAGRVLVEITREARAWLDSDLGVRFGK
jgi:DNA-binding MarR family transcriptional regulator